MNEKCVEDCALKRDCSGFEPKPNLKIGDMPRFPNTASMTKEEKFTVVTVYLAKIVDHLQGVEDEYCSLIIRQPLQAVSIDKPKAIAEVAADIQKALVETGREGE